MLDRSSYAGVGYRKTFLSVRQISYPSDSVDAILVADLQ